MSGVLGKLLGLAAQATAKAALRLAQSTLYDAEELDAPEMLEKAIEAREAISRLRIFDKLSVDKACDTVMGMVEQK